MKEIYYSCDAGSVAVKTQSNDIILYSNGYGDCTGHIYEMTDDEFKEYEKKCDDLYFITTATFNKAVVLDYDCIHTIEQANECSTDIILDGEYAIYNQDGDVYFVKMNRKSEK